MGFGMTADLIGLALFQLILVSISPLAGAATQIIMMLSSLSYMPGLGIAIAGTHGKTSTTSMIATIVQSSGLEPTIIIGGKVDALGGNARLGKGDFLIAEADESDKSFLHLPATIAIVTNIDNDHLDYYKTEDKLVDAFVTFANRVPFYGITFICAEDKGCNPEPRGRSWRNFLTQRFSNQAQHQNNERQRDYHRPPTRG